MVRHRVVGERVHPLDGWVKVTGQARYAGDLAFPGMLHAKMLRSPLPHARISNLDISRAQELPGVRAVITGREILPVKYGVIANVPGAADETPLAVGKVRYVGEAVAAVAAIDEDIANEALGLISTEYEPLPALFDPLEAMRPGAPLIHSHVHHNISTDVHLGYGDVASGLAESYYVREDLFVTRAVVHAALEPHAALALYEPPGRLIVWTSTQSPFYVRRQLALTLGLREADIRVIKPYVGGGFGGKSDGMFPLDFCAAVLSLKTGRPVKVVHTREEEFTSTRRRHPVRLELKTGVRRDGTLLVRQCRAILDGGAYSSWGPDVTVVVGHSLSLPYRLSHLEYEGYRVYTNNPPSGAMRGFGGPQAHFACEVQMDMIARDLGIDPLELRRRNCLQDGETLGDGRVVYSCGLGDCLSKVSSRSFWKEKVAQLPACRGVGVAASGRVSGAPVRQFDGSCAFSAAMVELHEDGTATLLTGASDVGQGLNTTLAQIVAQELGIGVEDVRLVAADTGLTPMDFGTFSSRAATMAGNAAWAAAADAKSKLFEEVAEKLEAHYEDLELWGGRVQIRGSPDRGLSWAEAVVTAQQRRQGQPLVSCGTYSPPSDIQPASFSFGAKVVEVEVDPETGQVQPTRVVSAHDGGVAINPTTVEGQVQGAVTMGLGYALWEEALMEEGRMVNPSFLDYKMASALDLPKLEGEWVETADPGGPFGLKEVGEGPVAPTAPAVANALCDAIGLWLTSLPLTPERVLEALDKKGKP